MIRKLLKILPWFALGYVLGAKAGQQRYEQIASAAQKVANSAPVQAGVAKAAEQAPVVADVVKEKVATAAHVASEKLPFGDESGQPAGAHVAAPTEASPAGETLAGPGQNGTGS
ncbi:hypothetical protein [Nocardioides sp. AE5]|uniref:hypothetical protein n=1 Tax=Nocardioides sp. AE5 TaxID=2962573 RepID=UPI002882A367|nr:hypothetical protein [Nocardioides sp. AE5]MDT0202288.1 hypothetical protein [Nocardioides sp. AE5]